jgi:hypothetical protein
MAKYSFKYINQHRLLIEHIQGETIAEETIEIHESILEKLQLKDKFNLLLLADENDMRASVHDNEKYINHFQQSDLRKYLDKLAVVCRQPHQVVQSIMFANSTKPLNTNVKVFNSVEAALFWLEIDFSPEETNNIISKLKKAS